jgi:uncharacterized membrane protein YdjX (TVP38/TMEM64 family)
MRFRPLSSPRLVLCLAAAALVVALGIFVWAGGNARLTAGIAFFRDAGPLPFFVAMAILPACGFPLLPFLLAAGLVFGPRLGSFLAAAYAAAALGVNASLSYWIADRAFRPAVTRWVTRLGYRLPAWRGASAWDVALLLRAIPGPPFFLQSYLLGLARIPFGIYLATSFVIPALSFTGAAVFGAAWARGDRRGLIFGAGVVIIISAVVHRTRRRLSARRAAADALSGEAGAPAQESA